MANYFEYTAGREGDHAVTMCVKIEGDISQAHRVDFDTANKLGAAGAFQCEDQESGNYINHNHIQVTPICYREQPTDPWQTGWTTPMTGNEAWNYGKAQNVAHLYQSTVMPLAASECQEPVTTQQTAAVQPAQLPSVGASNTDVIFSLVFVCGLIMGAIIRSARRHKSTMTDQELMAEVRRRGLIEVSRG